MSPEMQDLLEGELNEALESDDTQRIIRAMARISSAQMDCQRKTAERVKAWGEQIHEIKSMRLELDGLKSDFKGLRAAVAEIKQENRDREQRIKGATWVIKIVQGLAAGGGLGLVWAILKSLPA